MPGRTDSLPKILFSYMEACDILMVSRTTLWKLVKSNRLRCTRIGKRVFFKLSQLTDFLDKQAERRRKR